MHLQEWLKSLCSSAGLKGSEHEDVWRLLPSQPLSSLFLSTSSLLGLGALASLTAYWLVTRPRPMRPPCDLQAQSVAVRVSRSRSRLCGSHINIHGNITWLPSQCIKVFDSSVCCREILAAGDQLFLKMTCCRIFTTRTPGRPMTCSREA